MQPRVRTRNPAEKDKTILIAARRLFTKNGIDATSMADVAAAADVSVGSIYVRYPGKTELVAAVMYDFGQIFVDAMNDAAAKAASAAAPRCLPRFVAQELLTALDENQAAFRVLIEQRGTGENRDRIIKEIARHLKTGQIHGAFRPMNTRITAAAAYGAVEGVMKAWLAADSPKKSLYVKELGAALEGMMLKP